MFTIRLASVVVPLNYLGFPTGISGRELAGRAYAQAQKFGATVMIAKGAQALMCERKPYGVRL